MKYEYKRRLRIGTPNASQAQNTIGLPKPDSMASAPLVGQDEDGPLKPNAVLSLWPMLLNGDSLAIKGFACAAALSNQKSAHVMQGLPGERTKFEFGDIDVGELVI